MITTYEGWELVSGCFVAEGGESYITIGNFYHTSETPLLDPCPVIFPEGVYFFIDDVVLEAGDPAEQLDFDLGDAVEVCDSFIIDPQLEDVLYTWSDGSHADTLVVYESGLYSLTVTNGCNRGTDSIEVIIISNPPVELDPDELILCEGESFTYSLDDDLEYEWQDGNTDSEYTITEPGLYTVTANDGCSESIDSVQVTMNAVSDFTLGDDTDLCEGDEIVFNFDPALGDFEWQNQSSNSSFTITEGGTYALTITNECGEFVDEIIVNLIPYPNVFLGVSENICEGESLYFVLDPQFDYIWQDGSIASEYTITTPGTYSVTVSNSCGDDNDQVVVVVDSIPTVELGNNQTLCAAQLPYTLSPAIANATSVVWQDNTTGNTISVLNPGVYSVTVTNECGSVTDQVAITIDEPDLQVILPSDVEICNGDSILLTNSGAQGDYIWHTGSTTDSLWASIPGTYALTVTNQCGSGNDTVEITNTPGEELLDLGEDISLCPGENTTLYATVPNAAYIWQDLSTVDSFNVTSEGIYHVTVMTSCATFSDSILVSFNSNPPLVDLDAQVLLCQGSSLTIEANVTGVDYAWNDDSEESNLIVTSPGIYSVTVSNACGIDADSIEVLDAGLPPTVLLGPDISICPGESIILTPTVTDPLTWLWQDGTTLPVYEVTSEELIIVEVNNVCGSDMDSLQVTLLPAVPLLDLGADTSLCPGESLQLDIELIDVSVLWNNGSTDTSYLITTEEIVYASVSNACGETTDTINITALPETPLLYLGPDVSLCPGETIILSPDITGVDYLWQDGSSSTSITITQPGEIILQIINDCGTSIDTLHVIEDTDGPEVDLGSDVIGCAGEVISLTANVSGVTYLWQDGSTDENYTANSSGSYYVQVSNACGVDSDTIMVNLDDSVPSPYLGPDTILCEGQTLLLQSFSASGTSIEWQDGSTGEKLEVSTSGIYSLQEANHCGSASDSIVVELEVAPPLIDLGPDRVLCPGENLELTAPVTTASIVWQDGSTNNTILADEAQLYVLTLSNHCGMTQDEVDINFISEVPIIDLQHIPLCPGEFVLLDASQPFEASYQWSTGSQASYIEVNTPGLYQVSVSTPCHEVHDEIEVLVSEHCSHGIYIPNVFSPNEDGINDIWTISLGSDIELIGSECLIFDRWGNMIFQSDALPVTWDGRFREQALLPGVYVFALTLTYKRGVQEIVEKFNGDITIIR